MLLNAKPVLGTIYSLVSNIWQRIAFMLPSGLFQALSWRNESTQFRRGFWMCDLKREHKSAEYSAMLEIICLQRKGKKFTEYPASTCWVESKEALPCDER